MFRFKDNYGLTFVEIIVACAIFAIGLMAMVSATISFLTATRFSKNYLIGTGLAREGLEIVKNKRDENYLKGDDFFSGFKNAQEELIQYAILEFADAGCNFDGGFKIAELSEDLEQCKSSRSCQIKFFPNDNLYGNCGGGNGDKTHFYRLLNFEAIKCIETKVPAEWICDGCPNPADYVCNLNEDIGLEATVTVGWYNESLEMASEFYNWQ